MEPAQLNIRTLHGDNTQVDVLLSESVKTLKKNIALWQDCTTNDVIVMLRGRCLDDDLSLEAERVRNGAKLIVAVRGKRLQKSQSVVNPQVEESPAFDRSRSLLQPPAVAPPPPMPRGLKPAVPRPAAPPQPVHVRPPGIRPQEPSSVSDRDLAQLMEMGFTDFEAAAALQKANGQVAVAASILLGEAPAENTFEKMREDIRKDPSKLEFYIQQLIQNPQIRQLEEQQPGRLRMALTADIDPQQAQIVATVLENFRELGFTDEQAKRALAEANGNEQLALERLLS